MVQSARDRLLFVTGGAESLADAREHEDFVVRRQSKENHEQQRRRDDKQLALRFQADQVGAPTIFEDQHQRPVRGQNANHVEQDRLDRQDDRAEQERENQEREREDPRDQQWKD